MARDVQTQTKVVRKDKTALTPELQTDICVVGAGISGVSAAIEAARLGRQVTLVDSLPTLGGQAVNSVIGIFCGLFSNGSQPYMFTHGIADEILHALSASGAIHYRRGAWTTAMYDELALSRWIEEAVRKAGVTVITGAVLRGVTSGDKRIKSIELATRNGDIRVSATGFVDASGDASLTWQAGLPCQEPIEGPIYGSNIMVIDNVNISKLPTGDELHARQREKVKEYGLIRKDGFTFPYPVKKTEKDGRGTVLVNMTHIETPLEPVSASMKTLEGKTQTDTVFRFLQTEFPDAFGEAKIRTYGQLGIRQTRWIVGSYHLTVDDIRTGRKFPDAIARTAWPIELHDRSDGYFWEMFSDDHVHYIPLRSMTPPGVDNLVAAGRCIDGDLAALSSVRVMGPGIAMGAAAAHALDLAGTGSVHEISIESLKERLKDNIESTKPHF